jgi:hypothetical protein
MSVAVNVTNKTELQAPYLTVYSIIMLKLLTILNSGYKDIDNFILLFFKSLTKLFRLWLY